MRKATLVPPSLSTPSCGSRSLQTPETLRGWANPAAFSLLLWLDPRQGCVTGSTWWSRVTKAPVFWLEDWEGEPQATGKYTRRLGGGAWK